MDGLEELLASMYRAFVAAPAAMKSRVICRLFDELEKEHGITIRAREVPGNSQDMAQTPRELAQVWNVFAAEEVGSVVEISRLVYTESATMSRLVVFFGATTNSFHWATTRVECCTRVNPKATFSELLGIIGLHVMATTFDPEGSAACLAAAAAEAVPA